MAKKKASNSEGITLSEFRAWLEGVEDMQGPEWTPNLEQWRRIRAKIDSIEETEVVASPALQYPPGVRTPAPRPQVQGTMNGELAAPQRMPAPPMPQAPIGLPTGPNGQIKTPDIDSSAGYSSSLV